MNIGQTIKRLRKEKEMTQETLSEYLGVSISAVSQWEANKTSPDISLIAPICNLFEISADILLGIDLETKQKRINQITEEADSYGSRGYTEKEYTILTEGLREFPDSFEIMFFLMYNCLTLSSDFSYSKEKRKEFTDEAVRIAEFILERCSNDNYRHSAIQVLCIIYKEIGKLERAEELAYKMPTLVLSRECLLTLIHTGRKGFDATRNFIDAMVQQLSNCIGNCNMTDDDGKPFYTEEEKAELRKKQIDFLWLIFENGDMGFYHTHLSSAHMGQAVYYADKLDAVNTLTNLKLACSHSIEFIKYVTNGELIKTSLLMRGYESYASFSTNCNKNDAMILLGHMETKRYDFIRNSDEFSKIINELKPYAKNWDTK